MVRVAHGNWLKSHIVIGACSLSVLTGCNSDAPAPNKGTSAKTDAATSGKTSAEGAKEEHDHDHDHDAPHGGALVSVGEEKAHVEFVLDAETGKLTAYVLDGEAKAAVALKQAKIKIAFTIEKEGSALPEAKEVDLTAVEPKDGGASEFAATIEELKGVEHFDASIDQLKIGKEEYTGITFKFPEGNDVHDHDHDHDHDK